MDPFTAAFFAVVVAWTVTSSGARDMVAIAKGQTPPGHAERMAKLKAQRDAAIRAGRTGEKLPPALEPRRIRIRDLARHWWEDALEDADAWRARRRLSRPERRAAKAERRRAKKERLRRGRELLERWARGQLDAVDPDQRPDPDTPPEGPGPGAEAEVVDLDTHRRARETTPDQSEKPKEEPKMPATSLSDGQTYTAHQQALGEYIRYYRECAERMDAVADRLVAENAGEAQVAKARSAATAYRETADKTEAVKQEHQAKHGGIYEQRQAHTGAAEGRYLKTR